MSLFKISNFTLGSDFEVAVRNSDGIMIPALMIPGTKNQPASIGNDCFCQRDGVNFEANIPPVDNAKDWLEYTNYCFDKGNEILAPQGLTLNPLSSYEYDAEDLDQGDLRTLYCTDSFDAYNNGKSRKVEGIESNLRTCGYHVHIGFNRKCPINNRYPDIKDKCALAMYMDLYLGIPSVLYDEDNQRRNMYGKPGDFRFKVIGLPGNKINLFEYRSLGGNLLKSKKYIKWVFDATEAAISAYNDEIDLPDHQTMYDTIMNSDTLSAQTIVNEYGLFIV